MTCSRTSSTDGMVPISKYSRTCLTFRNFHLTVDHINDPTSPSRKRSNWCVFQGRQLQPRPHPTTTLLCLTTQQTHQPSKGTKGRPVTTVIQTPQHHSTGFKQHCCWRSSYQESRSAISLVRCNPNANAPVKTTKNMTAPNPKRAP
jgi:hypothetical protein